MVCADDKASPNNGEPYVKVKVKFVPVLNSLSTKNYAMKAYRGVDM
jgi:hypothetical protein